MAKQFTHLEPAHTAFIEQQHIFFTASAAATGRVNLSPRGADAFRVLDPNTVAYLDETGSGNETAAHLRENGRITFMFCSFEGAPRILRLYGRGRAILPDTAEWAAVSEPFTLLPGTRQIIVAEIARVQTSCGMAVPLLDYRGQRDNLIEWAEAKGPEGLEAYREEKNRRSIDGLPTPG